MNQRGVAIIVVLFVVGVLAVLSSGILAFTLSEYRASVRHLNLVRSIDLGEAGVDLAIAALRANPNYAGANYTAMANALGGYSVQVTQDGPTRRVIRATGSYPSNDPTDYAYTAKTIEAAVTVTPAGGSGDGVLGDRSIQINGGGLDPVAIDSYDSRRGLYDRTQARANVRVRINADAAGSFRLNGRVVVNGDVILGPGGNPVTTLVQSGHPMITGSVTVATETSPLAPVETSGGPHVRVSTGVQSYDCTVCRFSELQVTGTGRLVFTQPVTTVYVEGNMHLGGQGVGTAGDRPTNLTFNVKGSHVVISGDAALYAKVHAPRATVAVTGNGDLFGSMSARDLQISGNGDLHYDEALNVGGGGGGAQVSLLSWREWTP